MTRDEFEEIERLLADYRTCDRQPVVTARKRRRLETALVRHAEILLLCTRARQPWCTSLSEIEPAPPMFDVLIGHD